MVLLTNIGLLATPVGRHALAGAQQGEITLLEHAWLAMDDGVILAQGQGQAPGAAFAAASRSTFKGSW